MADKLSEMLGPILVHIDLIIGMSIGLWPVYQ